MTSLAPVKKPRVHICVGNILSPIPVSIDEGLRLVRSAADTVTKKINELKVGLGALRIADTRVEDIPVCGLVVAPEYFWLGKCCATEEQKNTISSKLKALTEVYQDVLFICGTVSWFDSANKVRNTAFIIRKDTADVARRNKFPLPTECFTHEAKEVIEINKKAGYYEETTPALKFIPGDISEPHIHDWFICNQPLKFSVEICLDHCYYGAHIEHEATVNEKRIRDPDLAFAVVVSNWVSNRTLIRSSLRDRDNLIHSSTAFRYQCDRFSNFEQIVRPFDHRDTTVFDDPNSHYSSVCDNVNGLIVVSSPVLCCSLIVC